VVALITATIVIALISTCCLSTNRKVLGGERTVERLAMEYTYGGEMIVQAKILIGLLQVCPRDAPDNFATQLCTAIFLWVHTVY
jgi:hypothetical protein